MSQHRAGDEDKPADPKKYICPKCKKQEVRVANCGCATCAACGYRNPCE